jgi:hypothetical protein
MNVLILTVISCSQKSWPEGIVKHIKSDSWEVIEVQSDAYGKSYNLATSNAEKLAIKRLIFSGIAESSQRDPMYTKSSNNDNNQKYFNQLFENNQYKKFITCSKIVNSKELSRNKFHNTIHCCISYRSLRIEMENKAIIKKLGF